MQRQAVPLLRPERPLVGTGLEAQAARDSGMVIVSRVTGEVSFYPEFYNKFQGEPNKLPGLQETSNYQTTVNRNSYFTYKGVSYYFSQHIEESLQTKRKQVTVQRDAIEGGHFVGHYVFVIDGQDNITFNFYILNNSSTPADGYVSFQVDPENWVQDAPLTLVKKQ
jgi:DNA-directed RNA polymerase beta subunit